MPNVYVEIYNTDATIDITITLQSPVVVEIQVPGVPGPQGDAGWTPIASIEADGARRVWRIIDWAGGTGPKPATGKYISATGPVDTAAEAIDIRGAAGTNGTNGASAYETAVANGFVGTEVAWLASLQGANGTNGLSAYTIAVNNGFSGTVPEWLASLHGLNGANGNDGLDGANGLSAYAIAVANGFVGDVTAWLASLQGNDGNDGNDGAAGAQGEKGWSPILANVVDGERIVHQIVDWTGGAGTKPSTVNQFIGSAGIVGTAALAQDIRGAEGAPGAGGGGGGSGSGGATLANYTFDGASTADANPGAGKFRLSVGSLVSVAQCVMYINPTDADANDLSTFFGSLGVNHLLPQMVSLYNTTTALDRRTFARITSVVAGAGYYKIGLDVLTASDIQYGDTTTVAVLFHAPAPSVEVSPIGYGITGGDDAIVGIPNFIPLKAVALTPVANSSFVMPFRVFRPIFVTALGFVVSTAGTTGNGRCTIYNVLQRHGDGILIGSLVMNGGVQANALATVGKKVAAIGQILQPGNYAMLVSFETFGGAPVLQALSGVWNEGEHLLDNGSTAWQHLTLLEFNGVNIASSADPINSAPSNFQFATFPTGTTLDTMMRSAGFLRYRALG